MAFGMDYEKILRRHVLEEELRGGTDAVKDADLKLTAPPVKPQNKTNTTKLWWDAIMNDRSVAAAALEPGGAVVVKVGGERSLGSCGAELDGLFGLGDGEGVDDDGPEVHDLLAAAHAVRGDDGLGAGRRDARGERILREAAEDDGVHGADARAGEHGQRELGHHGHK